jgi:putative transposase
MPINVPTRRFGRAVRLPAGDVPPLEGLGLSKSAVSPRFVALSAEPMAEWMAADLSELDLLIIQIDGIHIWKGSDKPPATARIGSKPEMGVLKTTESSSKAGAAILLVL